VKFVVVYQREPHARQLAFRDVLQPKNFEERAALARRTRDELDLDVEIWIDDMGDSSRAAFGDLPSWGVLISPNGHVMRKVSWPDPDELQAFARNIWTPAKTDRAAAARARVARSLAAAEQLAVAPAEETAAARRARQHDRRAHLAALVCAAPEHPDRTAWLQQLAGDGPAAQRAWALAQQRRAEPAPARRR